MVNYIHPMEVLLNTVWLLVAIGAFLIWRPEVRRGSPMERGHGKSLALLALACALVVLFPVISLTDDLHAEQAAMEDSSRSVMKARNLVQGCLRAGNSCFLPAATQGSFVAATLRVSSGAVVLAETPVPCQALISAREGRSPPSEPY